MMIRAFFRITGGLPVFAVMVAACGPAGSGPEMQPVTPMETVPPAETVPAEPPAQTEPELGNSSATLTTPDPLMPRLVDWGGVEAEVAKHAGKVVVLDIWSTSCEPCMREFPKLVALQAAYPDEVVCVSYSVDYAGIRNKPPEFYQERVVSFLTEQKANKVVNLMANVPADELFLAIDLDSIPAVCVFDRAGQLKQRFDNRTPAEGEEGISYQTQIVPMVEGLVQMK